MCNCNKDLFDYELVEKRIKSGIKSLMSSFH